MISTVKSVKVSGTEGIPVKIESTVEKGIGIRLVGIHDQYVRESLLRVITALQAYGYRIPGKRIIINISPADLEKSGSGYDLPVALTLIAATGQDSGRDDDGSGNLKGLLSGLPDWLVVGELALDGSVRPVPGCVQAVEAAIASGCRGVVIPEGNGREVADLFSRDDIPIYSVPDLNGALACIAGPDYYPTVWDKDEERPAIQQEETAVWNSLKDGHVRRSLEIAASGGHHVLFLGQDQSGEVAAARALRDILPPMNRDEALSVARVYSAAGKGAGRAAAPGEVRTRPFRNPQPCTSLTALFGGGCGESLAPGEVSLATQGVLCIQDFPEMPKSLKEALRGPLEERKIVLCRLRSRVEYPAKFHMVLTAKPCPCGKYGSGEACTCTPSQRERYLQSLQGPVYDMTDIQIYAASRDMMAGSPVPDEERAEAVSVRVKKARDIQHARLGAGRLNTDMTREEVSKFCRLGPDEQDLMEKLLGRLGLSARSYTRILKIARTIADIDGREDIRRADLAEASTYRFLDRYDLLMSTMSNAS